MSQLERLYRIEQMLLNAPVVSFQAMQDKLEVSRATLKRDLAYLRDRMNVPVIYDRFDGGYKLQADSRAQSYELPGLWFSADEIKALLTMHKLLLDLDTGGLLGPHIAPLLQRIRSIVSTDLASFDEALQRIQIQTGSHHRVVTPNTFQRVSTALLMGHRLSMDYQGRHANRSEQRTVSPQRLLYYRDNWYLAAYCHTREALRIFSLDAMSNLTPLELPRKAMSTKSLGQLLDSGYGIYNGGSLQWATLEFDAQSARWAQDERWHASQKVQAFPDGRLRIIIPYLDAAELVTDVLRWGEHVRVVEPATLKEQIKRRLAAALAQY